MSSGEPVRLTRDQMRLIDKLAIERYHIPGIVLMENAARAVVAAAIDMLAGTSDPRVLVLCGGGNNGGDGLAVARHLHNLGISTTLFLTIDPTKYQGDALVNWEIARAMNLPRLEGFDQVMRREFELYIDGMLGTGLVETPRRPVSSFIQFFSTFEPDVLAIDIPSGLDCNTGVPPGDCIIATRTVTFVAEKAGFAKPASKEYTGEVTVGDIGCPRELIEEVAKMSLP